MIRSKLGERLSLKGSLVFADQTVGDLFRVSFQSAGIEYVFGLFHHFI